jgi:UDP-N-acetylglucosamine 2-epimerase (non-hydrolysing)
MVASPGGPQVLCVAAARPNFMKIKPVLDALDEVGATTTLVHTGQHYDSAMSDVFFDELGLRPPDRYLGVGSGSHGAQTAAVMTAFEPLVEELAPDWVVVVGDVNSTLGCALVAAKSPSRLAHVEAGLRSRDWAMPEEVNRVVTDRVSDLLLAPSADGVDNLLAEGVGAERIELVGNVMIDTLLANIERARARVAADGSAPVGPYGLVTLHRPANVDDPAVLAGLLAAITTIAEELPLVFPVHPRTRAVVDALGPPRGVRLTEPLGYLAFVGLEAGASLVLTDSGGVQEETTALGVACLTLRDNTERPITVTEGTNQVVGRDPERIVEAARAVLAHPVEPRRPLLWDGEAGGRIARAILARS